MMVSTRWRGGWGTVVLALLAVPLYAQRQLTLGLGLGPSATIVGAHLTPAVAILVGLRNPDQAVAFRLQTLHAGRGFSVPFVPGGVGGGGIRASVARLPDEPKTNPQTPASPTASTVDEFGGMSAEVVIHPKGADRWEPYLFGGPGFGQSYGSSSGYRSGFRLAVSGGVGIQRLLGDGNAALFAEARYLNQFIADGSVRFVPVTFGGQLFIRL